MCTRGGNIKGYNSLCLSSSILLPIGLALGELNYLFDGSMTLSKQDVIYISSSAIEQAEDANYMKYINIISTTYYLALNTHANHSSFALSLISIHSSRMYTHISEISGGKIISIKNTFPFVLRSLTLNLFF